MTRTSVARLLMARAALSACALLVGLPAAAQTVPGYLQQIVQQNAPIVIEETDAGTQTNERAENHLMRLDFDGDLSGANNLANANNAYYPFAAPAIYYSIVETADAYYIGYYFYRISSGGTEAGFNKPGHEHDWREFGNRGEKRPLSLRLLAPDVDAGARGNGKYYDPNWFGSPPALGIPGEQFPAIGMIHHWVDAMGVSRPVVAVRRSTHGTYLAQTCDGSDIFSEPDGMMPNRGPSDPFVACVHPEADAMAYVPQPYPCDPASGCGATPVPQGGNARYLLLRSRKYVRCARLLAEPANDRWHVHWIDTLLSWR